MSGEPKYNSFTATDIERYYNGQMPAPERHALEKAALDDPFLADALEGYKLTPTPAADMAALKKELAHKTDKAKVVPIAATQRRSSSWFRIAALFLVLMGAGWSVYYLMDAKRDTLSLDNKESAAPVTLQAPAATPDTTPGQPAAPPPGPQLTFARPEPVKETNATAQKKEESRMEDQ